MKKILAILSSIIFSVLSAQKDVQFTHFTYVQDFINPASAAFDKSYKSTVLVRQQWFDFSGAPQTQLASFSMPLKNRWGLTAQLLHDKLGFENNFSLTAGGAYFLPFTIRENDYRFGIGFAGNFYVKRLDGSKLIYDDMTDPNGVFNDFTKVHGDVNVGISLSGKDFFVGTSMKNIIGVPKSKETIFKYNRNYYIFASYRFKLNEHVDLIPNYYTKTNFQVWEHNIQVHGWFEKAFMVGLNYRYKESIGMLLGIRFLKHWEIAYGYDIITGSIKQASFGSHDIVLHYHVKPLPPKLPYIKSPRYFN